MLCIAHRDRIATCLKGRISEQGLGLWKTEENVDDGAIEKPEGKLTKIESPIS